MPRSFHVRLQFAAFALLFALAAVRAQSPQAATASLHEIRATGLKTFPEDQVKALTQLAINSQVGKAELQTAADRLLQTGLFSKVNYTFKTAGEGLTVTFQLEEAARVPIFFDNFPWFADSELADVIRKKVPFFDGTLPEGGAVVDQASDAVKELLASHQLNVSVEHELIPNPLGEGNVQNFHAEGGHFAIASLQFSDPSISASRTIQQALLDVVGKPYSRLTVDFFLSEQVRPIYLQLGFLKVKLGPPEVRLSGNPNQKLPDQIPVFVPVNTGPVYRWQGVQWFGNSLLSTITLATEVALKPGDVADGMKIEAGWESAREEYAHRGFLEAKVEPVASYNDQATTVSYNVTVSEGAQYRFNGLVVTGLSLTAEHKLHQVWPILSGAVFDKAVFEQFLVKLQSHPAAVFGDIPLHYDTVGHWVRPEADKHTVDVLLDFK
ncbi:MAG: POTRA domain-containing protein [Candidatus Acidiferrum sp.]|jgi:outer membrane protein assembly factor BamA